MVAAEKRFIYLAHVGKLTRNYTNICHHFENVGLVAMEDIAFSNRTVAIEIFKILCLLVSSL